MWRRTTLKRHHRWAGRRHHRLTGRMMHHGRTRRRHHGLTVRMHHRWARKCQHRWAGRRRHRGLLRNQGRLNGLIVSFILVVRKVEYCPYWVLGLSAAGAAFAAVPVDAEANPAAYDQRGATRHNRNQDAIVGAGRVAARLAIVPVGN